MTTSGDDEVDEVPVKKWRRWRARILSKVFVDFDDGDYVSFQKGSENDDKNARVCLQWKECTNFGAILIGTFTHACTPVCTSPHVRAQARSRAHTCFAGVLILMFVYLIATTIAVVVAPHPGVPAHESNHPIHHLSRSGRRLGLKSSTRTVMVIAGSWGFSPARSPRTH